MKRYVLPLVAGVAAFSTSLVLSGCGASAESPDDSAKHGAPGTTEKDYNSNTQREFRQPDEFYDYGDYDRVKVIHLSDGTECVLYQVGSGDGSGSAGVDCGFAAEAVPTDSPTS